MPRPEFPYHLRFDNVVIKAVSLSEADKLHFASASVEKLAEFLPKNIDFETNYDILGIALNSYTPNLGNKNGHIIAGSQGIEIAKLFKNKYINLEHERKKVIGFITDYGFSTYPDDMPITEVEASALAAEGKVFNVVLSGIIWRTVNPEFADFVEASSDPTHSDYGKVSASWEIGFREFNIASGSKYLSDCTIIDDPSKINDLKTTLKVFGGNGVGPDGEQLFLNVIGNSTLSLGIGLTENPAADVKGLVSTANEVVTIVEETEASEEPVENNSDQNQKPDVINVTTVLATKYNMKKLENITDLTDSNLIEIGASNITTFLADKIANLSSDWQAKLDVKAGEVASVTVSLNTVKAEVSTLQTEKAELERQLNEVKDQIAAREADEAFQSRMTFVDDTYALSDEDRAFVVTEVKACGDDAAFEALSNKYATFFSEKNKATIAAREQAVVAPVEVVASVTPEVETPATVILSAEPAPVIPNVGDVVAEKLSERFAKAFGKETVKVSINR